MTDSSFNYTNVKKETMDKRDLSRLVDYYRMRVEAFERERVEWLERLEGLRMTQEESHKMEWELRRRNDEVAELQNALSESHIALNQERKEILHLSEELEFSKIRTKEDRRRLVQLLQLAEPIEQTIKLYYDRRPEKLEKFSNMGPAMNYDSESIALNKSLGVSVGQKSLMGSQIGSRDGKLKRTTSLNTMKINKNNTCKSCTTSSTIKSKKCKCIINNNINLISPKLEFRIPTSDEKQQIVRTVLLPNEETDSHVNEENEFLKKKLNEMKISYENQILRMEEDRRLREEEIRLREMNYREKIDELTKKNQKLDRINYELTKDHMQLKYESSTNEKKIYEELETVKIQNEALSVSLKELMHRTNVDKETVKSDYEKKTREITNVMRIQVKTQEENNNIIKEQYKQIQKIYTSRVKELEDKLKALTDKHKTSENRRGNETQGYINEINLMRKRLKSYEEYVAKIRRYMACTDDNKSDLDKEEAKKMIKNMENTKSELNYLQDRMKEVHQSRVNSNHNQNIRNEPQQQNQEYEENEQEENENENEEVMERSDEIAMDDF
jgi:hypothetical protein